MSADGGGPPGSGGDPPDGGPPGGGPPGGGSARGGPSGAPRRRKPPPSSSRYVRGAALRPEEREFLSPARSVIETPPSPVRTTAALVICALFAVTIFAAIVGQVDIYAEAQGRIQPIGRSKVVQPASAGKVLRVLVRDGSPVKAGQLLLQLDPTELAAVEDASRQKQQALGAEVARRVLAIEAALGGRFANPGAPAYPEGTSPEIRERETAVLRADLATLNATLAQDRAKANENRALAAATRAAIGAHQTAMAGLAKRVDIRDRLQRQGWESLANVLDAREDLDKERTDMVTAQGQLRQAAAAEATLRSQAQSDLAKFVSENAQALRDARNGLDQASQDLVKASSQLDDAKITSPIDGTVQQLGATTIGQVVTAGQQLLTVVPENSFLEVEADMQNQDIGFVRPGNEAVVKVEAFPFTRYGVLKGRVVRVSRDAVDTQEATSNTDDTRVFPTAPQSSTASQVPHVSNLVYPVTVRLDRATIRVDGRDVPLTPGMTVTVEVRTGKRRVISYLMSPFLEATANAGHER